MKKLFKWVGIIIGVFIIISIATSIFAIATGDVSGDSEPIITESENVIKENWTYSESVDPMTEQNRYFATCKSTNEIEFEFPYNGGSYFHFTVRNMGKGNEVILKVSKGQFMTSIGGSQSIKVKFDKENPIDFTFNSASDGSSDVIFLNNADLFVKKLKLHEKALVAATFYDAGTKHISFDINGLNWDK